MGYMIVDDRKSGGGVRETDTFQCPHCQRHLAKPLRNGQVVTDTGQVYRPNSGAFCMKCGKPVCDRPPCNTRCVPFFAQLEKSLRRQAMLQAMGVKG